METTATTKKTKPKTKHQGKEEKQAQGYTGASLSN